MPSRIVYVPIDIHDIVFLRCVPILPATDKTSFDSTLICTIMFREISSTHAVTTKLTSERRAIVSLGDKGTCPDRDFAVLIEQADPFRTRAILVCRVL